MDTFPPYFVEEKNCMTRGEEEEKKEKGEGEEEGEVDVTAVQKQRGTTWGPRLGFFSRANKEVYHYVGKEIIITEGLDSYAGLIWPGALALCRYLDNHHEQLSLVDKAVLEIGAGTGLVSVVAALLGAWVTATDLPAVLGNLRVNVSRNTRGHCRHTPQVSALSWGFDLESTFPTSVYHYDYVLAADVVYHHDNLDELLATMKHFCRPGTAVIWANKLRFETDLMFAENFKKAFHTSLLAEDGEVKIFMATCRGEEEEGDVMKMEIQDLLREKEQGRREQAEDGENKGKLVEEKQDDFELRCVDMEKGKDKHVNSDVTEGARTSEPNRGDDDEEKEKNNESDEKEGEEEEEEEEEKMLLRNEHSKENERNKPEKINSSCPTSSAEITAQRHVKQTTVHQEVSPAWAPIISRRLDKDVYHYAGQDIVIYESIDSYGAVMWPAALALCSFLDNNRERLNMQGKEVLELGAGTGLVTIVASLLGASVTATDLPEVLGNLLANVMRNTRGRCRHTPKVAALSWGHDLEHTYPTSVQKYDFVLAADVVYHHSFLDELLATMKHFCRPGTTVIWANKVRMESDVTFTEKFKKAFHTSLLAEDGEMKIFMATCTE